MRNALKGVGGMNLIGMLSNTIELVKEFRLRKRFPVRGSIPFAKKMWRDGYNKALDEMVTFLEMEQQKEGD